MERIVDMELSVPGVELAGPNGDVVELSKGVAVAFSSTKVVFNAG